MGSWSMSGCGRCHPERESHVNVRRRPPGADSVGQVAVAVAVGQHYQRLVAGVAVQQHARLEQGLADPVSGLGARRGSVWPQPSAGVGVAGGQPALISTPSPLRRCPPIPLRLNTPAAGGKGSGARGRTPLDHRSTRTTVLTRGVARKGRMLRSIELMALRVHRAPDTCAESPVRCAACNTAR